MVASMHGVLFDVAQRVVHPPHVPLEIEAEPAVLRRRADAGKRGRFLGDGQEARVGPVDRVVHLAQKLDGFQILPAPVAVRQPLAGGPAVIQIQHGRDGIDAHPVHVIAVRPEQRIRHQEVADLVAAVVEDLGAPFAVFAQARIRMLVQRRSVEAGQAVGIAGKMPRHPVEDHAEPCPMARVDERHEVVR